MSTGTTTLSQKHYAEDILRTYGFWGSHPLATMLPPHTRLSKDYCDPVPERVFHLSYRGIVGSLGYLVNMTRPVLDPTLRLPTLNLAIVDTPWGWVDSDWSGDTDTRRSHATYIIMMNGGPISWKSRLQDSVVLSTSG
jgi:hypothetical protein